MGLKKLRSRPLKNRQVQQSPGPMTIRNLVNSQFLRDCKIFKKKQGEFGTLLLFLFYFILLLIELTYLMGL